MIRTRTARVALAVVAAIAAVGVIAPAAASARSFTADVSNFVPYHLTPVDSTVKAGIFDVEPSGIKAHSQSRGSFVAKSTSSTSSLVGRVAYEAQAAGQWGPSGHVTIEFGVPFIGLDSADCYVDQGMKDAGVTCRVARAPSGDDPRVEFVVERVEK